MGLVSATVHSSCRQIFIPPFLPNIACRPLSLPRETTQCLFQSLLQAQNPGSLGDTVFSIRSGSGSHGLMTFQLGKQVFCKLSFPPPLYIMAEQGHTIYNKTDRQTLPFRRQSNLAIVKNSWAGIVKTSLFGWEKFLD